VSALSVTGIAGYVIIMLCLLYMGVGFAKSLKAGGNGITLGLMLVFFSLANEHLYLFAVATALLYPDIYAQYVIAFWLWRMATGVLVLASFTVLFIEVDEVSRRDKKSV
jgi:hypothetical protein